jgi:CBS domain-containing protein
MLPHNFYDALLEQDGHDLERFTPPRDLPTWHRQPVSALANPRPITVESLDIVTVKNILAKYPYQAFPVVKDGTFIGILSRAAAETALKQGLTPSVRSTVVCRPEESLKEAELAMIEQGATFAVVIPEGEKKITGILTLHDLLRAGLAASERSDDGDK